jgi:glucosyl-3-phosphoglycerate synthase
VALPDVPWTFERDHFDAARVDALARATSVAVIVPARDEAATIGPVVAAVAQNTFISELLVVNDHSSDDTAAVAAHHGARVLTLARPSGKGAAMAEGLAATTSEIVVYLDADVLTPVEDFVPRLIEPLLAYDSIHLVKGFYERPLHHMPTGGGRVNELAARPILSLLYPGLGEMRQPLAGETAATRGALEAIDFEVGYSVEIALLIDIARKFGVASLAQVDLGVRRHRNRPLEELRPMAGDVLRAALERFGLELPSQD